MADEENDLPDEGAEDSPDGDSETAAAPQGVTIEQLQARIAELETHNTRQSRDLIAAIGRLQSLDDRLKVGQGDADAVATLRAQIGAANEMLDALLEDEAVDPKVKAKASAVRTKAQAESERARVERLEREIEELKKPRSAPAPEVVDAPTPFEEGIIAAIEASGLDPDDSLFDWKGEATRLLKTQGQRAVTAYFRTKIAEGLEAKSAATRREGRRTAGLNQAAAPSGGATDPLDPSRPLNERYAELQRMGAI